MSEDHTQFDYLLNAFEQASQHPEPASQDYAEKRRALFAYVRALEADAARVDWMEGHPHGCAIRHPDKWRVPDYDSLAVNHTGETLREAIDDARTHRRTA